MKGEAEVLHGLIMMVVQWASEEPFVDRGDRRWVPVCDYGISANGLAVQLLCDYNVIQKGNRLYLDDFQTLDQVREHIENER